MLARVAGTAVFTPITSRSPVAEVAKKRIRTCIGCGKQSDKVELHRIVRTADGHVRFDGTGRVAGRGAYVCSKECFETANARGKLQRSLKCGVGQEEAAQVAEELERALGSACAR
ncbi:MAG: YlxR family protein [Eggerthellaceae bacterium]|nr:YlxR family protein [Eggerthellaceae bacterium]